MNVCLYVCLSVCLTVCMFVCLYVCMSVCLTDCLYVCMYVCICVGKTCNSIYNKTMHPKKGKAEKIWRKFQGSFQGSFAKLPQNFHAVLFLPCDKICRIRQFRFCRFRQNLPDSTNQFSGTLDRITFKNFREFSKICFV